MRERVASATFTSLVRIAGGGCYRSTDNDSSSPPSSYSSFLSSSWMAELERISYSSVLFPNGTIDADGDDDNDNDGEINVELGGKPHDVEVRAALILFHSVFREGKKKKAKPKKGQKRKEGTDANTSIGENDKKGGGKRTPGSSLFKIESDMGTRRMIHSVVSLASLLSTELEAQLRDTIDKGNRSGIDVSWEIPPITILDARPDESGIICLISQRRYVRLRLFGQLPCPDCPCWLTGKKGLWWHGMKVHGIEYSIATGSAATVVGEALSAIVPFEVGPAVPITIERQLRRQQQLY